MSSKLTRRGFLKGSITGALVSGACAPAALTTERPARSLGAVSQERVPLHTSVNGEAKSVEVGPDESALSLVRERLGLTGAKLSCGHGACGACTVLVEGTPRAACLLPATALEGKAVTTIEGISEAGLHPVQRAFLAEDALQCGFCTPGFVVEATAFYEEWRKEHGTATPSRDEVAAVLSGHLCRCGAYPAIYAAVQAACAGVHDDADPDFPRKDAREKVTGAAKYTVDIRLEGQLEGKVLRSPHGHARVTRLDWSEALAAPGVRAVVRLLGEGGLVRYAGQEILALCAEDGHAAEKALKRVVVEYEILPALVGMDAARAKDAAPVYPRKKDRKGLPNTNEAPILPEGWEGNLRGPLGFFSHHAKKARRAIKDAEAAGGVVFKETFRTQIQCHTSLEPHACVARWEDERRLTVYLSTQAVSFADRDLAEHFGLKQKDVRVLAAYVGGGFGSKATLTPESIAAAALARAAKAPVRIALDRHEELLVGGNRPAEEMEIGIAADGVGDLAGMTMHAYADGGCAVGSVVGVVFRLMYPGAPKELLDWDVTTHGPPGKPKRAPGGPPAFFALEQAVDEIARRRGEDPLALRRRWDPHPIRKKLYEQVAALPLWTERGAERADKGRYRRGVGIASATWFCFVQPTSRVQLDAGPAGIVARSGCQDMGNGTRTTIANAVAGVLGIPPREVEVEVGDSALVHGPMSGGSRTTPSIVPPAEDAARKLIAELVEISEDQLGLVDAQAAPGGVKHKGGFMPWSEVLAVAPRISVVGKRRRDKGGYFIPFGITIQELTLTSALTAAVQITEVEIDTRLGQIRPRKIWAGFGAGRIVAPKLAKSQVYGGITLGLGYALYEERRLDPRGGYLLTAGLEDYRITGIGDIPEIEVHFCEEGFEQVPGRAVGFAELTTLAVAPSLCNAVVHATGWRPTTLPLRPDRVLNGITT